MSVPINKYPAKGDSEVIPRGLPKSNPAFLSAGITGVETNHSSLVKSIPTSPGEEFSAEAEGAQWNDDEDSTPSQGHLDPAGDDPNLSGPHPTEPLHDWKAGGMSGFQDNDDYMDYTYATEKVAESRLLSGYCYPTGYSVKDGDYDDNGGIDTPPTGSESHVNHSEFGTDESAHQGDWGNAASMISGIAVDPIIRR